MNERSANSGADEVGRQIPYKILKKTKACSKKLHKIVLNLKKHYLYLYLLKASLNALKNN